ncbi:hypothetical protein Drose_35895 [Dactylosporangium roseum]|uniref:Uncharacterized protein n=1 Tax=Dactylosporangium roseum TaxID=47989 RepID=A0ABY5Z5R6_9ACTN|nr:hypothetical protein [Dactylosporangium roseum]UWZ36360.1 hypothetical protein Drose_35895 [Dactylosporangium roseum]
MRLFHHGRGIPQVHSRIDQVLAVGRSLFQANSGPVQRLEVRRQTGLRSRRGGEAFPDGGPEIPDVSDRPVEIAVVVEIVR